MIYSKVLCGCYLERLEGNHETTTFSDQDSSRVFTKYKSSALLQRQPLYVLIALELLLTDLEVAMIFLNDYEYVATAWGLVSHSAWSISVRGTSVAQKVQILR
jgi:hypothetical protein